MSKEHGPRQPWHDIHSSVRGPLALHLVQSFTERWLKQAPRHAGELINLTRLNLNDPKALENKGGWSAQLSRSIDSRVNSFDPSVKQSFQGTDVGRCSCHWTNVTEDKVESSRRFETAADDTLSFSRCLDQKKGRLVDSSIHMTNIHYIRRAKHFIYIESQYFMGSSFMWSDPKERCVKCGNMIAAEVCVTLMSLFSPTIAANF